LNIHKNVTLVNKRYFPCLAKSLSILVLDDDFDIVTTIKLGLQRYDFVYNFTDPYLALNILT